MSKAVTSDLCDHLCSVKKFENSTREILFAYLKDFVQQEYHLEVIQHQTVSENCDLRSPWSWYKNARLLKRKVFYYEQNAINQQQIFQILKNNYENTRVTVFCAGGQMHAQYFF
eukprot:TRINITY_DN40988_c0_g1_i1.p4 TRINITY_DN40988_c0_g1~~TRINITY_DN40988_c0_g1_i1.p4  ORF type:complete len:114 (-),score=10.72 TRINITY_DN40988_c0_g1_i1:147-488(-)